MGRADVPAGASTVTSSVDGVDLPIRAPRTLRPISRGEHRMAARASGNGLVLAHEVWVVVR